MSAVAPCAVWFWFWAAVCAARLVVLDDFSAVAIWCWAEG